MTKIEEADANLKDVIDRALRGEAVVITRGGAPVVQVSAAQKASASAHRMTADEVAAMRERAMSRGKGGDAGQLLQNIRDEDWR